MLHKIDEQSQFKSVSLQALQHLGLDFNTPHCGHHILIKHLLVTSTSLKKKAIEVLQFSVKFLLFHLQKN